MYPFNASPGSRTSGPTFGAVGNAGFDDRDAQFITGFNTGSSIPSGQGVSNYVISSVSLTLTISLGDTFVYDPTSDSYRSYLDPSDPNYLADSDAGRPIELFGLGYRNGFSLATFLENSAFAPPGPPTENVRNAYALGSNGVDVSNNVTEAFEANPWAVGQASGLIPGDSVPLDQVFIFTLNLTDPFIVNYIQEGLNFGQLNFALTSLHLATFGGGAVYPNFYTKENLIGFPAGLLVNYEVIPEPGTAALAMLGLAAIPFFRRNRIKHPSKGRQAGFTMVELLVVIAIVGVVAGLTGVVAAQTQKKGLAAEEISAARQVMTAYHLYVSENNGQLLAGYKPELTRDAKGADLHFPANARYPWKLAPYLDYQMEGTLFVGKQARIARQTDNTYGISVGPSFGLNVTFVGGDFGGASDLAPTTSAFNRFGNFCALRMTDVAHPSKLIVFASARSTESGSQVEGYYHVKAPNFQNRRWSAAYDEKATAHLWGFVHPRHERKAVFAFLDGRVALLDKNEMQDMRLWAPLAAENDDPNWTIKPL